MPDDFKCPHCEAEYYVTYSVGLLETGSRNCDSCGQEMAAWTNARRSIYIRKPRSGEPPKSE
jgi:transcription elongation factor Elf1